MRPMTLLAIIVLGVSALGNATNTPAHAEAASNASPARDVAQRDLSRDSLVEARSSFDRAIAQAEGLSDAVRTIQRDMARAKAAALGDDIATARRLVEKAQSELASVVRQASALDTLRTSGPHLRAVELANRIQRDTPQIRAPINLKVPLQSSADALLDSIGQVNPEEARNKRQEFQTSFENFDEKAQQLFNTLSSILKAMKEMRAAVTLNII